MTLKNAIFFLGILFGTIIMHSLEWLSKQIAAAICIIFCLLILLIALLTICLNSRNKNKR